ncbi:MAG: hypothetical protein RL115_1805 [Bacteroidota bacterium]|jgi:HSP20 family protein
MTNLKLNVRPFEGTFSNLVDNLFTDLPTLLKNEMTMRDGKGFAPVNIKETKDAYVLEIVAPGFVKEDFKVKLDQQLLTITAEHKAAPIAENEKQIRKEYHQSSFKRTFTVDEKIDPTKIAASYINGILILNLSKKEVVNTSATYIDVL